MSESDKEKMLELLSDKAFADLSEAELVELAELEKLFPELKDDDSFEVAASAVSLTNLNISERMPPHLQAKILADADQYFASRSANASTPETDENEYQKTFGFEPRRSSVWQWLGWVVAAFACIALAVNVWTSRSQSPDIVGNKTPTPTPTALPAKLSPLEERAQFLASAPDAVQTQWTNPKQSKEILGDIVWSNAQQKGFLRFRGLPANDPSKESYQLWIVDKTQTKPIDGGVFDITQNGEIVIPIDAKLKVKEPAQFAVTAEKPGGVVVSNLGKVMAVAKIET